MEDADLLPSPPPVVASYSLAAAGLTKAGFRDGVDVGKLDTLQSGFDAGYAEGCAVGVAEGRAVAMAWLLSRAPAGVPAATREWVDAARRSRIAVTPVTEAEAAIAVASCRPADTATAASTSSRAITQAAIMGQASMLDAAWPAAAASAPAVMSTMAASTSPDEPGVPVLTGTCGWTDETLFRCHRFYPSSARSATDRLRHYSRQYPCVEIDTSTYAIPRRDQIRDWLSVVPPGFLFHIKIWGLFASRSVDPKALPRDLRGLLTTAQEESTNVKLNEMSPGLVDALWLRMNEAIGVLHAAGALGVVVWQFHTNFTATPDNMAYVVECRRRMWPAFRMAVEFRSRTWYAPTPPTATLPHTAYHGVAVHVPGTPLPPATTDDSTNEGDGGGGPAKRPRVEEAVTLHGEAEHLVALPTTALPTTAASGSGSVPSFTNQKQSTMYLLRRLNLINIPSDDLAEEWPTHEAKQPSYRDGRLFVYDDVTSPDAAYIRLHRRVGKDRLLSQAECDEWAWRMHRMAATATPDAPPFPWLDPTMGAASPPPSPATTAVTAVADGGGQGGDDMPATASTPPSPPSWARFFAPPAESSMMASAVDPPAWGWTRLAGPIFFMIGTDWEDQPMINLKALARCVEMERQVSLWPVVPKTPATEAIATWTPAVMHNWRATARAADSKTGLASFFVKQPATTASATAPASFTTDGADGARQQDVPLVLVGDVASQVSIPATVDGVVGGGHSIAPTAVVLDGDDEEEEEEEDVLIVEPPPSVGVGEKRKAPASHSTMAAGGGTGSAAHSPMPASRKAGGGTNSVPRSAPRSGGGGGAAGGGGASSSGGGTNLLSFFKKAV